MAKMNEYWEDWDLKPDPTLRGSFLKSTVRKWIIRNHFRHDTWLRKHVVIL